MTHPADERSTSDDAIAAAPDALERGFQDSIRAHVERYIGKVDHVFASADEATPISIQHVAPTAARPFHTLITSGMSARTMDVPAGDESPRRLELMMTLPEKWEVFAETEQWIWPLRQLRHLAHYPRERKTWLGWGHTIPNGEPPSALAPDTQLCGAIIAPSLRAPIGFYELAVGAHQIAFYSVIPIYREEMELKRRKGMEALLTRLLEYGIKDVVDPRRRNVGKRFFGLF